MKKLIMVWFAIVGFRACGKSTFLKILMKCLGGESKTICADVSDAVKWFIRNDTSPLKNEVAASAEKCSESGALMESRLIIPVISRFTVMLDQKFRIRSHGTKPRSFGLAGGPREYEQMLKMSERWSKPSVIVNVNPRGITEIEYGVRLRDHISKTPRKDSSQAALLRSHEDYERFTLHMLENADKHGIKVLNLHKPEQNPRDITVFLATILRGMNLGNGLKPALEILTGADVQADIMKLVNNNTAFMAHENGKGNGKLRSRYEYEPCPTERKFGFATSAPRF